MNVCMLLQILHWAKVMSGTISPQPVPVASAHARIMLSRLSSQLCSIVSLQRISFVSHQKSNKAVIVYNICYIQKYLNVSNLDTSQIFSISSVLFSPSFHNLLWMRCAIRWYPQAVALLLLVVRDLCLTPQPSSLHFCIRKHWYT